MIPPRPQLRELEAIPFEHDGEEMLLLRDPNGLTPDAQVPRALAPILGLFDGSHSPAQIAAQLQLPDGAEVPRALIEEIARHADERYLLESPRFEEYRREIMRSYLDNPTRPAAFAGLSYPDSRDELHTFLQEKWDAAAPLDNAATPGALRGIMVPHIDFHRGGVEEALAWRVLNVERFDVIIALGIAHGGVRYPFCATTKNYDTPLGVAACDRDFVQALASRVGDRLLSEEIAHRQEHSLEFVACFQKFCPNLREAKLVPILCGGFWHELKTGADPADNRDIKGFCDALRDLVRERESDGQRVALVASVDMAHVGTQFGDSTKLTPQRLQQIRDEDAAFLRTIESGDNKSLHAHITRDQNARNVDAHPALWTLLHAFPELRGQLLRYEQAFDARRNAVVSFASLALYS